MKSHPFTLSRATIVIAFVLLLAVSLNGCSNASAQNPGPDNSPSASPMIPTPPTNTAPVAPVVSPQDFAKFVDSVRAEAMQQGISKATLDVALKDIKPIDHVIELDRRQPEFTLSFDQYVSRVVTAARIAAGKARYKENAALLEAVGKRYGVQPRFIVALWGIETGFGQSTGGFSIVPALATLAYEGRRAAYFRAELLNALKIIDQGNISAAEMKGSWAGAMGQSQFMPSTFLNYAIDWDGDGKRDIWHDKGDVFASAANFLKQLGWNDNETWGRRVRLPAGFASKLGSLKRPPSESRCSALGRLTADKPVDEWQAMGVRRADGGNLPKSGILAAIALPEGPSGPALLVYGNFRATLKWNCSISFAAAVGSLADGIGTR